MDPRIPVALLSGEEPPVPSEWNMEWAANRVLTLVKRGKSPYPEIEDDFPDCPVRDLLTISKTLFTSLTCDHSSKIFEKIILCIFFFTSQRWFITSLFFSCSVITP
jgi:hypothetical protein